MHNHDFNVNFIIITSEESEQRIDNFLLKSFKKISNNMIYKSIRKGKIRINGKKVLPYYKLKCEDRIGIPALFYNTYPLNNYKNIDSLNNQKILYKLKKSIIYEDNDILLINKPYGLSVHGGSGIKYGIIELLRSIYYIHSSSFLELVHRLDKDTSGVLLIAKKKSILRELHMQLRNKEIQKIYIALIHGRYITTSQMIIKQPIKKEKSIGKEYIMNVHKEGKFSETHIKIIQLFDIATLVQITPITGRTHQIRVHAKYTGFPVICDNKYGNKKYDKFFNKNGFCRLFLHALSLSFIHPVTKKNIIISASLDKDFIQCIEFLKNINKINRIYYKN